MSKTNKSQIAALIDLIEPGLSKKIFGEYGLDSVKFEFVDSNGSPAFWVEMTYPNAKMFLRWFEDRGRRD
jgi:hypothetical protein